MIFLKKLILASEYWMNGYTWMKSWESAKFFYNKISFRD